MFKYTPNNNEIGKTLLEILFSENDAVINAVCSGNGSCGKCLIKANGELSAPSEHEKKLLGNKLNSGYRLACYCRVFGEFRYEFVGVKIAEIQTEFEGENVATSFTKGLGIAVDVGTTTVAVYLVDLATGEILSTDVFQNPQTVHGADVISRISFSVSQKNAPKILYDEINNAIIKSKNKLTKSDISRAVICGNTIMQNFLCGIDASSLAKLPFSAPTLFGCSYNIPLFSHAYLAPCIGGYVGGDISMGAVAVNLDRERESALYIDIGTNGEIVLISKEKIYTCATAAGPAFEGANIECGCSAVPGAISRVYLNENQIEFDTLENNKPCGICGSGLIDCIAVMLECGMIDENGRFEEEKYHFTDEIFLSQRDIRNIQLAKAAISAGIDTLLDIAGLECEDISKIIIAGGFGTHINIDSARKIGLIPSNVENVISVGNSAGHGAVNCVLSDNEIKRTEDFAGKAEYIELSLNKKFNQFYIEEMCFEEKE